jgi:RNA polymerase sigma-70 factor (ECF subfamily)
MSGTEPDNKDRVGESREQFERIYQDCYAAVYRYSARRVAPEAVQDVVADTFLTAWRRHSELKGEPLPWLLGIARRTAANQRRGGARRDALRERLSVEQRPSAAQGLAPPEQRLGESDRDLAAALATLSARDREALTLVAWDGLEHRAAARVMGCSTGAFSVRVHRARRKLERALAGAGAGAGEKQSAIDLTREAASLQ